VSHLITLANSRLIECCNFSKLLSLRTKTACHQQKTWFS